jgi:hypothetical protein
VVKDSTFPDPSLAKEVKDSSLTILVQFYLATGFVFTVKKESGYRSGGFLQRGRIVKEKTIRFGFRELDLVEILYREYFPSLGLHLLGIIGVFMLHIYLFS